MMGSYQGLLEGTALKTGLDIDAAVQARIEDHHALGDYHRVVCRYSLRNCAKDERVCRGCRFLRMFIYTCVSKLTCASIFNTFSGRYAMTSFADLGLHPRILESLSKSGYQEPTPIQAKAIPLVLQGKDVLGCAQTGTGKTAAFLLPVLHKLQERGANQGIKALVVSPTRDLAAQIGENCERYAKVLDHRSTVIFGGVKQSSCGTQTRCRYTRRPGTVDGSPWSRIHYRRR